MGNTTISSLVLSDGSGSIIIENNCRKESAIVVMPMYLLDSDETDTFDYGGVTKILTITGVTIAESIADLKTWIDSIEALQQGHQDVSAGYPLTFTDDLRGTLKVKVLDFDSTWSQGTPTKVDWTIKLVQSSENA